MQRPAVIALLAGTVALSVVAFDSGRRSVERSSADLNDASTKAVSRSALLHGAAPEHRDLSKVAIENIAEVDFRHAYDLIRSASPEVLAQWAKRLEGLPASPRTTAAILSFYKTLSLLDTKTAVDLVLNTSRRDPRTTASGAVQAAAPAANLAEIGRMLVGLEAGEFGMVELIHEWSRSDPVNASKFADSHVGVVNSNARQLLLSNWAAVDPAAAGDWLDGLDPALQGADVYDGFYSGWFEHNRQAAVADLVANSANKKMRDAIQTTALRLFKDSTDETTAFVLALADSRARASAISRIVHPQIVFGGTSDEGFPAERIAKWLFSLPEDVSAELIGNAVTQWAAEQPASVDAWLNQMDAATHDRLVTKVALALSWREPQQNLAAGLKIQDVQLRERTLKDVLKWIHTLENADELLRVSNFSAAQLRELQRLRAEL